MGVNLRTVLVVDDEPSIRYLWARVLATAGYEVVCTADAIEAEHALGEYRPAVVICDVHLTGASGLWLAELIRRAHPSTAIILVSADPTVPPCETLRSSVVAYLLKPVQRRQLLDAVEQGIEWVKRTRTL